MGRLPGVSEVRGDAPRRRVVVVHDAERVTAAAIARAIASAGFTATIAEP